MFFIFAFFIISLLASFGLAIALTEKADRWPLKGVRVRLQWFMRKIKFKWHFALFCPTCASFWASLIIELCLLLISIPLFILGVIPFIYFLWPISGFAILGLTWFAFELLNSFDEWRD